MSDGHEDSLDAAWDAVVAAMPAGWRFLALAPGLPDEDEPEEMAAGIVWEALATEAPLTTITGSEPVRAYQCGDRDHKEHADWQALYGSYGDRPATADGWGVTAVAALYDLAARLRKRSVTVSETTRDTAVTG